MEKYDAHKNEKEILDFWKKKEIYEKVKNKIKEGEDYYFLDGPPYTSGFVHIGTAWNKTLKDCILRYKRAKGFKVWDRAGYDMHGLPVEHKVQSKLKLDLKEDIVKFGVDKFIKECRKLAEDNLFKMNDDFIRLGVWMDFENAYKTISNEYIDGVWWLIKTAHENNRLYENFRTTYWDYVHQSALAKHELEYESVVDKSIFVKFPIKGKENEFLIAWTTTPWTIAYNLGIMVNPKLDYIKAKVNNETWILAKGLAAPVIQTVANETFETINNFKGEELKGTEYIHPFQNLLSEHYDLLKKEHPNVHTVVLSEEHVTLEAGTGLVHMAPGCGPEDYEVGYKNNIPAWNNLKEDGRYPEGMNKFSGWHAKLDNDKFTEELDSLGMIVAVTEVEHDYPFGQRSHKPVVFRATKQWFFKVEDLKENLIKENNEIKWTPETAYNAFNSWLNNLRDNSISKQRFWGTPLPIWRNINDPDDIIVIGSKKELEEISGQKIEDLHIPFIDKIEIHKDNKTYKRISDVLDVWVDAGTASWNCLDFPSKEQNFKNLYPADLILEGKDQIRGWFNLLSIASMLGFKKKSFKNVYMHGFVQDAQGRKMSKSQGNTILPEEVISKYSADTLRYYMIGGSNPGLDINYNFEDMKTKNRNLDILWNLHNYLIDLTRTYNYNPNNNEIKVLGVEEKLMISKLNSTIKKCSEAYDNYNINEVPKILEDLFLHLSRNYIQKIRDKISSGNKDDRESSIQVIFEVLMNILKMFNTISPFISEKIYLNFKEKFSLKEESINLFDWPKYKEEMIDLELEESFEIIDNLERSILYAREKAQIGMRWPVKEIIIETKDSKINNTIKEHEVILKNLVNVKEIKILEDIGFKKKLKVEFKKINNDYGNFASKIIAKLTTEMQNISKKIEKEEEIKFKIDDAEIILKKEHFISELEVPDNYSFTEAKKANIFLNKNLDEEQIAEGYTREVIRRIQIVRKDEGLNKLDVVKLKISCSNKIELYLKNQIDIIKDKVGANKILLLDLEDEGKEFKIKEEIIKIHLEKI